MGYFWLTIILDIPFSYAIKYQLPEVIEETICYFFFIQWNERKNLISLSLSHSFHRMGSVINIPGIQTEFSLGLLLYGVVLSMFIQFVQHGLTLGNVPLVLWKCSISVCIHINFCWCMAQVIIDISMLSTRCVLSCMFIWCFDFISNVPYAWSLILLHTGSSNLIPAIRDERTQFLHCEHQIWHICYKLMDIFMYIYVIMEERIKY